VPEDTTNKSPDKPQTQPAPSPIEIHPQSTKTLKLGPHWHKGMKPPWPKGVSGNPRGRPKGKSVREMVIQVGAEKLDVTVNGQSRRMSRDEVGVRQLYKVATHPETDLATRKSILKFLWEFKEGKAFIAEPPKIEENKSEVMEQIKLVHDSLNADRVSSLSSSGGPLAQKALSSPCNTVATESDKSPKNKCDLGEHEC
jgi:hypothetical protein